MKCNRCGVAITDDTREMCWYCDADLCYRCWDEIGHCGHEGAEKLTEIGRKGGLPSMTLSAAKRMMQERYG